MHIFQTVFWNANEARLRAGARLALHLVLWFMLALFLQLTVGSALTMWASQFLSGIDNLAGRVTTFIFMLIAVVGSTWIAARYLDHRPFADLGFHVNRDWWVDFFFGLALGGLLMALVFGVEYLAGWVTVTATFEVTFGDLPFWIALLGPIVAFICVGFYEELVFRGYQLRNLAEGMNFQPLGANGAIIFAWLCSSILFGFLHIFNPNAGIISTLYLILAGLFLGLGFVMTGSLAIPIGLHIGWNFVQGNVFGFPVSGNDYPGATFIAIRQSGPELWTGGAFGPEAGFIGILAILLGCLATVVWVRWRYHRVTLCQHLAIYEQTSEPLPQISHMSEGVR